MIYILYISLNIQVSDTSSCLVSCIRMCVYIYIYIYRENVFGRPNAFAD